MYIQLLRIELTKECGKLLNRTLKTFNFYICNKILIIYKDIAHP
jgi:hypothetical protein